MLNQGLRGNKLHSYWARCMFHFNKRQLNKYSKKPHISKKVITFFATFRDLCIIFLRPTPTLPAKAKWSRELWPLLSQSSTSDIFTSNDGDVRWTGPERRVYADTLDSLWASIIAPPEATRCVQTPNITPYICVCVCDRMGMCLNLMARERKRQTCKCEIRVFMWRCVFEGAHLSDAATVHFPRTSALLHVHQSRDKAQEQLCSDGKTKRAI